MFDYKKTSKWWKLCQELKKPLDLRVERVRINCNKEWERVKILFDRQDTIS